MRRFFIALDDGAFRTLAELASQERRDVRDQAAVVLEHALKGARASATDAGRTGALLALPERAERTGVPA